MLWRRARGVQFGGPRGSCLPVQSFSIPLGPEFEAWPDQPSFNYLPSDALGTVHLGDVLNVTVSYDAAANSVSARLCDVTNSTCYEPPGRPNYSPDRTTAEWIAEDPQTRLCVENCFLTPWFTDLSFFSPSYFDVTSGERSAFALPLLRMVGEGGNYTDSQNQSFT